MGEGKLGYGVTEVLSEGGLLCPVRGGVRLVIFFCTPLKP